MDADERDLQDVEHQPLEETETPSAAPPASSPPPRGPSPFRVVVWLGLIGGMLFLGHRFGSELIGLGTDVWKGVLGSEEASESASGDSEYYTCGMHPWVILPKPGLCPVCGMDLVPMDVSKFQGEVTISPVVEQNIGVRVERVTEGPLVRTIRTVGNVAYDETRVRDINIKVAGWIEKLHVDYLGEKVERGDPLFDLYSPELYAAQEEFLLAWRNRDKVRAEFLPDAERGAKDLLAAARTRLEYFDITEEQIRALIERDEATKTLTLLSPYEGVVTEKHANEGMRVDEGMQVYRISDLSKVWVMVTLYEYQLPYVSLGQTARMSLPYIPGQVFEGRVIYIYPYLDQKTRQVNVRLEFDNPGGLLKPGMFATVELESVLAEERTLAPRSAIIDTGERQVAFVSLGQGRYEPRQVLTGIRSQDDRVEILDGLEPGELVVTSAQFLIDSEARIREALAKMISGNLVSQEEGKGEAAPASELESMPEAAADQLDRLLEAYLTIGDRLARDSAQGVSPPARTIAEATETLFTIEIPQAPHFWHTHGPKIERIRDRAVKLAEARDLREAREQYADLSLALEELVRATGVPKTFEQTVLQLHCPMYRDGQGGSSWLQLAGDVRNPYFGAAMLRCYDRREPMPVTGERQDDSGEAAAGGDRQSGAADSVDREHEAAEAMPVSLSEAQWLAIDGIFESYLTIQQQLADDQLERVPEHLEQMRERAHLLSEGEPSPVTGAAERLLEGLPEAVGSIEDFRLTFKEISLAVIELARTARPDRDVAPRLYQIHCPMTKGDWLQRDDKVANPYYGQSMLTCGSVVEQFPARER